MICNGKATMALGVGGVAANTPPTLNTNRVYDYNMNAKYRVSIHLYNNFTMVGISATPCTCIAHVNLSTEAINQITTPRSGAETLVDANYMYMCMQLNSCVRNKSPKYLSRGLLVGVVLWWPETVYGLWNRIRH